MGGWREELGEEEKEMAGKTNSKCVKEKRKKGRDTEEKGERADKGEEV